MEIIIDNLCLRNAKNICKCLNIRFFYLLNGFQLLDEQIL